MLKYIIILAIVAFLIVLTVIYYKEIKLYIKSKLTKKFKKKSDKPKETKPKEDKKSAPTVEDFKPIYKPVEQEERDSSIERLFSMDEVDNMEHLDDDDFDKKLNEEIDKLFADESQINVDNTTLSDSDKRKFDEFFGQNDISFRPVRNKIKSTDEDTIAQQIKNLSPELKALLLDNALKRRDDV